MGELRNRVFPLHQAAGVRVLRKGQNLPMPRLLARVMRGRRAGESELGSGESVKRAQVSSEGRKRDDGHLPSASQSNHFPNLLFCSAAARDNGPVQRAP